MRCAEMGAQTTRAKNDRDDDSGRNHKRRHSLADRILGPHAGRCVCHLRVRRPVLIVAMLESMERTGIEPNETGNDFSPRRKKRETSATTASSKVLLQPPCSAAKIARATV